MPEEATICAGCGMPQVAAQRPKAEPMKAYMSSEIAWGKKNIKASKIASWLIVLAVVLAGVGVSTEYIDYAFMAERTASIVSSIFGSINFEGFFEGVQEQIDESYEKEVSGTVLVLRDEFVDRVLVEEYQKKNGDWFREELIDEKITVKFYRFTRNEDWLNTHIFALYPNITKVDSYENSPVISGYSSRRILIPSEDENQWINAVIVDDSVNDYIFIIETTKEVFTEYEYIIEDWINTLQLADSSAEVSSSDE